MRTQLNRRVLDVSLSPSGGEIDLIEGEAVRQAWCTQNMCWKQPQGDNRNSLHLRDLCSFSYIWTDMRTRSQSVMAGEVSSSRNWYLRQLQASEVTLCGSLRSTEMEAGT